MRSKLLVIGISGFLLISIMFAVLVYKNTVQTNMELYNWNNVQMTLDVLKTLNDYSNLNVLNEKICNNSNITNPADKRGNEILIYYSRKFIRSEMVYHQDYNYCTSKVLLDNNRHFVGKKGYTKGKGIYPYPPSVSVLIVDNIKLSELVKEEVLYGLNPYNKWIVVALVFSDGFYIYQIDNKGNKINECEFLSSNNVSLKENISPELAREAIVVKYRCKSEKVIIFDEHPHIKINGVLVKDVYYSFQHYNENGEVVDLLINKENGNVYKFLPKDVHFNIYDVEKFY